MLVLLLSVSAIIRVERLPGARRWRSRTLLSALSAFPVGTAAAAEGVASSVLV